MEWIKTAADIVERNSQGVVKSFQVTGIVKKPECTRSDALQREIQLLIKDVFGLHHMSYVEPTEDPFADSDSSFEDPATGPEDNFSDSVRATDTDYSELEYSEISEIESSYESAA